MADPQNKASSPNGWHTSGSTKYTSTRGNNGVAQPNKDGDANYEEEIRPDSLSLDFSYPYNVTGTPDANGNASTTQLFFTANMYHDLLYTLGFNEVAGNFQLDNGGKGGAGNDEVSLNTLDSSAANNAYFATPPDGERPRMSMGIFNRVRDSAFDKHIVLHEYTHGLSNRLTGGPANAECLETNEAGGMGEGWSDFMGIAALISEKATRDTDTVVGAWAINNPKGVRTLPYSTNMTRNTYTWKSAKGKPVHQSGTVWATMLYEIFWNIVDKKPLTADTWPVFGSDKLPTDGRFLTMKIIMEGLAL